MVFLLLKSWRGGKKVTVTENISVLQSLKYYQPFTEVC